MQSFYILVIDKNNNPNNWVVTSSAATADPLEVLLNHHDQIVAYLPKALYPGILVNRRKILNTHNNGLEDAGIYRTNHV